jgi:hypothetical protein
MEKRLPALIERRSKHLDQLRANQSDPAKDRNGSASSLLAGTLRFLGVAQYMLGGDVQSFRTNLSEAAALRKRLFERSEAGDAISRSYVSILAYKSLFDALAAADMQLGEELAAHMGQRDELERQQNHPLAVAFGYALKSFVLDDPMSSSAWLGELKALCDLPENADFKGYPKVFEAILDRSVENANAGFVELLEGHRRQSEAGGTFADMEDEMLCVWGTGLANLARVRGLSITPPGPLIPTDLLRA